MLKRKAGKNSDELENQSVWFWCSSSFKRLQTDFGLWLNAVSHLISFTWRQTQLQSASSLKPDPSAAGDRSTWRTWSIMLSFVFHLFIISPDYFTFVLFLSFIFATAFKSSVFPRSFWISRTFSLNYNSDLFHLMKEQICIYSTLKPFNAIN